VKIYLIYFIIAYNFSLFSQTNNDYVSYHQACRQAEKFFIDSNYTKCFQTYDSLFKVYDFLFPRDCFTAGQLAAKAGKDSLAVEFLKKGVPFGLNADLIFKANPSLLISTLRKTKYWTSYSADFPSLRQQYINRIDWRLKKELHQMVAVDQKWRTRNNKWFNRTFRKGLEKKYDVVNKKHVDFLDSVFKIKGYAGIWLTGVGDSTDIAFNNNGNLSEIFSAILYHYDSAYVKYGDFLKSEITKGHIHPRTYAIVRDFQDRFTVKREKDQNMYYNIWWEATNYSEQEYERHCHAIGCPTKKHLRQLSRAAGNNIDIFWYAFR
jgi:hypothetical protein